MEIFSFFISVHLLNVKNVSYNDHKSVVCVVKLLYLCVCHAKLIISQ